MMSSHEYNQDAARRDVQLRPYQKECLLAIVRAYRVHGMNRLLVSLPTGCGKTVIFSLLPRALQLTGKTLVLAHREELLEQARARLIQANPGLRVEIEQAERKASPEADIVVASVPSIGRSGSKRIEKFSPEDFGLLICDECHHAAAPTYRNIFAHFGLPSNKDILLTGFTATPRRTDGLGLEEIFETIVYHKGIKEMIKEKWLCPVAGYRVESNVNLSDVRTVMGDFAEEELSAAVNNPARNALVIKSYLDHARGRKTLVFAADVRHSRDLTYLFQQASVAAESITGETPRSERQKIIEAFRSGALQVLVNCQVLTEGFDEPGIEFIILARPTQSSLLYAQMIGRGTRLAPGKARLAVIDIVDNSSRHSLMSIPALFGLPAEFNLRGADAVKVAEQVERICSKYPGLGFDNVVDLEELKTRLREVDLFAAPVLPVEVQDHSRFVWSKLPGGSYRVSLGRNSFAAIQQNLLGQYEVSFTMDNKTDVLPQKPYCLPDAFRLADRHIEEIKTDMVPCLLQKGRWRNDRATEEQINLLQRLGIAFNEGITKGEASILINRFFSCGKEQRTILRKESPEVSA